MRPRRANALLFAVSLVFSLLLVRLYYLQVICHAHYADLAARNSQRRVRTPGDRGTIYDASGNILAANAPAATVLADRKRIRHPDTTAHLLAVTLGVDRNELLKRMRPGLRRWVELVRRLEPRAADQVKLLRLPGIHLLPAQARRHPHGRLAVHVVGITSADGAGLEGIEKRYDSQLRGVAGHRQRLVDAGRRPIAVIPRSGREAVRGRDVVLTIDLVLQTAMSDALDEIMDKFQPKGACGVVVEANTGRILALGNRPDYDPNRRRGLKPDQVRNRSLTDAFEPGSTFKSIVWAAVFDAGLAREDEVIFCHNGAWRHRGRVLHDSHAYGNLTVADGLVHSSNIMAAMLGMRLQPQGLHDALVRFGIGRKTGIGLHGEAAGLLRPVRAWNEVYSITSIPMGQEVQVTPLQLAMAYTALASGGRLLRPRIVERIVEEDGTVVWQSETEVIGRAVSEQAAQRVLAILERVVREGTGKRARVDGYRVGGKTGTAQKALPGRGYVPGLWVSSFVAVAPVPSPRVVCLILVDEPKGAYYGSRVAAPSVGKVLARALLHLKVARQSPPAADAGPN